MDRDTVLGYILGFLAGSCNWVIGNGRFCVWSGHDKPLKRIFGLFGGEITKEATRFCYSLAQKENSFTPLSVRTKPAKHAYLAGMLEADGAFAVVKTTHGLHDTEISITVPRTNEALSNMNFLTKEFGGSFSEHGKLEFMLQYSDGPIPIHCDSFRWSVDRQRASSIARTAKPYLTFRHDEAELVRLIQTNSDLWMSRCKAGSPIPFRVLKKQNRWARRLVSLSALAETKPEQVPLESSYSPICSELLAAGLQGRRVLTA